MRINKIIIIVPLLLFSCCSQDNKNKPINDNMLLAKEVKATCVAIVDNQDNPDWTRGFNNEAFFKNAFNRAFSGEVPIYGEAFLSDLNNKKLFTAEDIKKRLNGKTDKINFKEFKQIIFYEKWEFNKEKLQFYKEVIGWTPIKFWNEDGKTLKKMIFNVYPENPGKGKLIAENIFYELPWDQEYPDIYTGFDQDIFIIELYDGIKSGEIETYDPIYLVDKSKRKFTPKQLKEYMGRELESDLTYPYYPTMGSILFEEDWYFDENSLGIRKVVKSIAFVWVHVNTESGEWDKKIMFFIFPK
ncbi:MAG: hypothetical protein ABFS35_15300 [Bacteroidota bacterium]